jgi:hypothetical protein
MAVLNSNEMTSWLAHSPLFYSAANVHPAIVEIKKETLCVPKVKSTYIIQWALPHGTLTKSNKYFGNF